MGVQELGGPAGLQVLDVAEPHPGPGEVRIRVHGATVNPTDTIFIAGPADGPGPYVPGADAAGMSDVADRPPHHLSFGQRRRVAVATVLAMRPDVLVLDEPSSNLDPASRRELAQIVRSLGLTTLMVTHDLPYAAELCERSVILSDGIIVADRDTQTLLGDEELLATHRLEMPYGYRV